jgi:hypothetical protein
VSDLCPLRQVNLVVSDLERSQTFYSAFRRRRAVSLFRSLILNRLYACLGDVPARWPTRRTSDSVVSELNSRLWPACNDEVGEPLTVVPVTHPHAYFASPGLGFRFPALRSDRLPGLARLAPGSKPRLEDPAPSLLVTPIGSHRWLVGEDDDDVWVLLLPAVGFVHC